MDRFARAIVSDVLSQKVERVPKNSSCDKHHLAGWGVEAVVIGVEHGSIVNSVKSNNWKRDELSTVCCESVHKRLKSSPTRTSAPETARFHYSPTSLMEQISHD